MAKNNQGIALVAGLLIAILISVVGFAGYYVYNENKAAEEVAVQIEEVKFPTEEKPEKLENVGLEGWVKYEDKEASLTLYYPREWIFTGPVKSETGMGGYLVTINSADYQPGVYLEEQTQDPVGESITFYYANSPRSTLDSLKSTSGPCAESNGVVYDKIQFLGYDALQSECNYEHDGPVYMVAVGGGYAYVTSFVSADVTEDETKSSEYPTFQKFLDSVTAKAL